MSLTKLSLIGNNDVIYKLFPSRECLVPAAWGHTVKKGDEVMSEKSFRHPLKVHKIEIFLASILKCVIFLCQLCQNIKILGKQFFDWTIMGGATNLPRSLKTTRNEKHFKIGRN
jgi:hypothetical protein